MKKERNINNIQHLIKIVKQLKAPDGCPWDRKQTHKSLLPYLLEEAYEVVEAVETNNFELLKEELGDLMLHIIFQAELASEANHFSFKDSVSSISKKLIDRHPYVFSNTDNEGGLLKNQWEIKKQKEKNRKNLLDGMPLSLPALLKSQRIQEKVMFYLVETCLFRINCQ